MSPFQIRAVATIVALCALDGFDVFAITFAAPALLAEWGIGKAQLGIAIAAGLVGMAVGSLALSPLADMFGRRRMLLISLAIMIIGTTWTAMANSMFSLTASRVFTGLGIGAMISVIMPLASEFANARRRDLAIGLLGVGFPVGGIVGGFISSYMLAHYGWRSIFIAATILGILMFFVSLRLLLEPIALVIAQPRSDGLARVNLFLKRCSMAEVSSLPPPPDSRKVPIGRLFEREMAGTTVRITFIYFLVVIPVFFMQTWLPTLIADLGIVPSKAAMISAFFSIGGVMGGLVIAMLAAKFGLRLLLNIALVGGAVMIVAFSRMPADPTILIAAAMLAGFFVQGSMIALYAIIARTFPAEMRASGTGLVVGIGRIGSIVPPALAGLLAAQGLERTSIALLMAAPALVAVVLLLGFVIRPPTNA